MNEVKLNSNCYLIIIILCFITPFQAIKQEMSLDKFSKVSPDTIPKKHEMPLKKISNENEELVPILKVDADSTYIIREDGNIISNYDAKNMLTNYECWSSCGNHGVKEEVHVNIEFEESQRLVAMWLYWAFSPGEFRIEYSNDKIGYKDIFPEGYRLSMQNGSISWWKKILTNPITRWEHRSFDDRVDFPLPVFAKYVRITMRIPVNEYFGIYKVEFYKNSKSVVLIKSSFLENTCMSVINGDNLSHSKLIATDCTNAITYGDNRDLFVINSNGFISTFSNSNRCIQSPDINTVEVLDCSKGDQYQDDRNKWIVEHTGIIRSKKDPTTCLSINNNLEAIYVPADLMKITASSTQNDDLHSSNYTINYAETSYYWASEPVNMDITFEILFKKRLSMVIHEIQIIWKFPAKNFQIYALTDDGIWKFIFQTDKNRETTTKEYIKNQDIRGIKIIMKESTTKVENYNIYGISNVYLFINGKFLIRDKCRDLINDVNKWELINVYYTKDKFGIESKNAFSELNQSFEKFKSLKVLYETIPSSMVEISEKGNLINSFIKKIGEYMMSIKSKLTNFETLMNKDNSNLFILGTNEYYPAVDCQHIKLAYPHKRSGFYFIKNECMNNALKFYCDFSIDIMESNKNTTKIESLPSLIFSNDYYIHNTYNEEITTINHIKHKCADIGLEPIEIKNYKILRKVKKLIKEHNFDFKEEKDKILIPLALDYNCTMYNQCSDPDKYYRSFNSDSSTEIKDLLKKLENSYNLDNQDINEDLIPADKDWQQEFMGDENILRTGDIAALGKSGKIVYTKLKESKVIAVVCSSNKYEFDPNDKHIHHLELACTTNFHSDALASLRQDLYGVTVRCPGNCAEIYNAHVYGTDIYTDHSSICRAAIHSGSIKDALGGVAKVSVLSGKESYKGSSKNYVDTLDYPKQWNRSFSVSKYDPFCPINSLFAKTQNNKFSSFLSIESEENLSNKNTIQDTKSLSFLLNLLNKNKNPNAKAFKINQVDILKPLDIPKKQMNTEEALVDVQFNQMSVNKNLSKIKSTTEKFRELIGQIRSRLSKIKEDKERGLVKQQEEFEAYQNKIKDINRIIFNLDVITSHKINRAEHEIKEFKKEIGFLLNGEDFNEDYTNKSLMTNYQIFNSKKGKPENKQSKWEYYKYNLQGHNTVIKQTNAYIDDRTGSHLIINNRDFYDFELKCGVFISAKNENVFGVAFRYKDPFNYYILEFSKKGNGFARMRKFIKGESKALDLKYNGGYIADQWFYIKIIAVQGEFTVEQGIEENSKISYQKLFQIFDNELAHGTIAFTSYGMDHILLDNISVIQYPCSDVSKLKSNYDIITNSCARYVENFLHMYRRWFNADPLTFYDGPSNWNKVEYKEARRHFLFQSSDIYSTSDSEEGSMYILDKRLCQFGSVSVKIKPGDNAFRNNGSVGIVFKYIDNNNYFVLEIFKESVRIRKKINGEIHLVKINQALGFKTSHWFNVILIIKNNSFNGIITKTLKSNISNKLFENDAIDDDLKIGRVGLWTYKTSASFDEFEINPIEDIGLLSKYFIVDRDNIRDFKPIVKNLDSDKNKEKIQRLNKHIENFNWQRCLLYTQLTMRIKQCGLLFNGQTEINNCNSNFCPSCCNKFVEKGNNNYKYLCVKQCKIMEQAEENDIIKDKCINSASIYSSCDNIFKFDLYKRKLCKSDMCKLCCISIEKDGYEADDRSIQSCEKDCFTKKDNI